METANVMSMVMRDSAQPVPEVGMGVTILHWTDREVGTIVRVVSEREFKFTMDETAADKTKPGGMGHQEWIHTPMPDGPHITAMKDKQGRWRIAHPTKTGRLSVSKACTPLSLGRRDYYHDWCF